MRYVFIIGVFLLFAACSPIEPTGMASSAISDSGDVRISYVTLSDHAPYIVRVYVRGEVVSSQYFIDNSSFVLSGDAGRSGWLIDGGVDTLYLEKGYHTVEAVSCSKQVFGFDCQRISRDIRIPS
jgi:hypothetical protein